jgi:hypothetical protein
MRSVGQLGREQRAMERQVQSERDFLQWAVHPRGADAAVDDQDRWFEYRLLTFHITTAEASLNMWGACGWDSKVISQKSTDAGHSECTVFVILVRAHNGPAPGMTDAVILKARALGRSST